MNGESGYWRRQHANSCKGVAKGGLGDSNGPPSHLTVEMN